MRKRLLGFSIVGVFNTMLNIIVFNVLIFVGVRVGLANLISICLSIVVAFILSSHIVFNDRTHNKLAKNRFLKFIFVNIFTLFVIHQAILLCLVYQLTAPGELVYKFSHHYFGDAISQSFIESNTAKALAVLGSMAVSYVLYDKFVFKDTLEEGPVL